MIRFEVREHYDEMCFWYKLRNMMEPPKIFLPKEGLIVPHVAAGFLIQTDCNVGILDFFITNIDAEKHVRAEALKKIAEGLIKAARSLGLRAVKCDSKFSNIKELAEQCGFTFVGESSSYWMGI